MIVVSNAEGEGISMSASDAREHVRRQIADHREWFAEISAKAREYLSVVKYEGGECVVIFVKRDPYQALDASRTDTFSARRAYLMSEGTQTIVPENVVLDRSVALAILEHYIDSSELDSRCFWLPDESEWPAPK